MSELPVVTGMGERRSRAFAVITDVSPLADIQAAFEALDQSPTAMKSLIQVGGVA